MKHESRRSQHPAARTYDVDDVHSAGHFLDRPDDVARFLHCAFVIHDRTAKAPIFNRRKACPSSTNPCPNLELEARRLCLRTVGGLQSAITAVSGRHIALSRALFTLWILE